MGPKRPSGGYKLVQRRTPHTLLSQHLNIQVERTWAVEFSCCLNNFSSRSRGMNIGWLCHWRKMLLHCNTWYVRCKIYQVASFLPPQTLHSPWPIERSSITANLEELKVWKQSWFGSLQHVSYSYSPHPEIISHVSFTHSVHPHTRLNIVILPHMLRVVTPP